MTIKSIEDLVNLSDEEMLSQTENLDFKRMIEEENAEKEKANSLGSKNNEEEENQEEGNGDDDDDNGGDGGAGDEANDGDSNDPDGSSGASDDGSTDSSGDSGSDVNSEDGNTEQEQDSDKGNQRKILSVKDNKNKNDKNKKETNDNEEADGNKVEDTPPNYEDLYKQIMKPFKANGREVTLNSPEEVIKLMQMGANYTKKMQALQPNLKILRMLENNQLLDENKINELIDITKGNKAAISKYLKNSGIDPMDIDTESEVNYTPGNHSVSDREINFDMVLDEVVATETGQELIIHIEKQWDRASKEEILKEPALIRNLAQHKSYGIYDQIAAEVEKQKMLGHPQIANLPFIHAYKAIGEYMSQQGLLKANNSGDGNNPTQTQNHIHTQKTPLAKAPAPSAKRSSVSNSAKAKAASPSAGGSKKAQQTFNPLAVSDEEFLEQMKNRV